MEEELSTTRNRGWIVWLNIFAVALVGVGIFFYYTFLRQSQSELVEAIPTDALFLFEINDNASFVENIPLLQPYFNETLGMDALAAYETIYNQLPKGQYDISISGHNSGSGMHLLFNTRIEKTAFKKLLRALSIDPANFQSFEQYKIYNYGTNMKRLKFVYYNHILSISDDIDLLQKSVIQHTYPHNLLSDKSFKNIYHLTEKNKKQNWLIINNNQYINFLKGYYTEAFDKEMHFAKNQRGWSAFQIRISKNELFLSGYCSVSPTLLEKAKSTQTKASLPENMLPFGTCQYEMEQLNSYTVCQFKMLVDTTTAYDYLLVVQDSLHHNFSPFISSEAAEQMRSSYPNGVYPTTDSMVSVTLPRYNADYFTCFIEVSGCYLFAPSIEALSAYQKDITNNGSLQNNRFYQYAANNTVSESLKEFTFFNMNKEQQLASILSEQGMKSHLAKDLRIFSFSRTDVAAPYTTVNMYFNFGQ